MDQKERIIEQAMQMFVTQGIKSVRMDDIAQQLGVSKRTLYELFGDKEGLLYLAMDRYFEKTRLERSASCADARNVLEAMFMVLGGVMDNAEVIQRLMNNLRKFYPAVYQKMASEGAAKSRRDLKEMLELGIADGLFVETFNLELAISLLYYTASAITVRKDLMLPEGMPEREAFVQIVSNFFRGISTAKGLQLVDDYVKRYEPAKTENKRR
ncbi:TetR/AcrR family transcriptional regulator [Alistipes provencensis]|uniref:TetR/AcrR family transcriptional regulator n=1 Tax=Alistipes provencensis TaxID=1816676 RepID=UPI0007ED0FF1|nr:TetR/AcrR family transcriptional regulator [Alistipes provencensis]